MRTFGLGLKVTSLSQNGYGNVNGKYTNQRNNEKSRILVIGPN